MAKYRVLSRQELEELEKEFVDYLVVNGITADDWERLKSESPDKAERIVELFSDVVLEDVLRRVRFLEYRTKHYVLCYQCLETKLLLLGMKGGETADFTDTQFLQAAMSSSPAGIELIRSEKSYDGPREAELFKLLSAGHEISDGALFKALALAMAD
jgi:hypothetical protein